MSEPKDDAPAGPQRRYITKDGFERFQKERAQLWNVERRKVVAEVTVAAAHGDRSENAEYIYGKRRLREIDRRLQYLDKLLDDAITVDPTERRTADKAYFGCYVTVEDDEGETTTYQLVGPDEFDAKAGKISIESPLGKALLGKPLDATVTVQRPKGAIDLTITEIH
jgi:transcription elongation factor GreB